MALEPGSSSTQNISVTSKVPRQVRTFVTGGGADKCAERNVFANRPLRAAPKKPIGMTTGLRVRQKGKHFRQQGPFIIQRLSEMPFDNSVMP